MPCGRETAHVGTDLGDDDLGAERTYAGDCADDFDGGAKGAEVRLNLPIDRRDRAVELIDLSEMQLQEETMMRGYPPPQDFSPSTSRRIGV